MKKSENLDTNQSLIVPLSSSDKLINKKERKALLQADQKSKISAKKQKRFDKFVQRQLEKERRQELLANLEKYHTEVPLDFQLQTASTLGSKTLTTAKDKSDRSDRLVERKKARLKSRIIHQDFLSSSDEQEEDNTVSYYVPPDIDQATNVSDTATESYATKSTNANANAQKPPTALGSGLKRASDGSFSMPVVVKRRRTTFQRPQTTITSSGSNADTGSESSSDASESDDGEDEDSTAESCASSWHGIVSAEESEQETAESPSLLQTELSVPNRVSFKTWGEEQQRQLNQTDSGQTDLPSNGTASTTEITAQVRASKGKGKEKELTGPLGEVISIASDENDFAKSFPTPSERRAVARSEAVQSSRLQLPILSEEDAILHAIRYKPVVVLSGETGSGKTTQVPQFLYEAGFGDQTAPGMIGITQPRRVAAVSMAKRVTEELAVSSYANIVAHQIRYETTVSPATRIKFMTDGVLLRELGSDFLLSKYSVIIIDEAHERTVNTDILLGVLSRVVGLRLSMWQKQEQNVKPLRLVIMSATLRLSDFLTNKTLFPTPPPCITIEARQYPVTLHFSRRTGHDYLEQAYKKVLRIHSRLPPGGILVFLTGQAEINSFCKRLRKHASQFGGDKDMSQLDSELPRGKTRLIDPEEIELGQDQNLPTDVGDDDDFEDKEALESDEDAADLHVWDESDAPIHVLPLYSLLPTDKQMLVFNDPPAGHRLVVVATNVAETSLTIPGIRYIVDAGRAKERQYNHQSGMQTFHVEWVSKASASQRAGRAGRVGPGHCYRLYSSTVYEEYFADHAQPEILRMPAENMVLQMKSMGIDVVHNFPFPTPPDRDQLVIAERTLVTLGALHMIVKEKGSRQAQVTDLGKAMSLLPLSPRYSKMILTGQQHGCLPYVIAIVCALSGGDPFLREDWIDQEDEGEDEKQPELRFINNPEQRAKAARSIKRKQFFTSQEQHAQLGTRSSDAFRLLSVIGAYEHEQGSLNFCQDHFVRPKAMDDIHKLRSQIVRLVLANTSISDAKLLDPRISPPSDTQLRAIRQLLASSFVDQIAVRKDVYEKAPLRFQNSSGVAYRAMGTTEDVFIHSSSVLFNREPPEYVCFGELQKTSRIYMKMITQIQPAWLSTLGRPLCTFTKVLESTPDRRVKTPGPTDREREVWVSPQFGQGSFQLTLPPVKIKQHRFGERWQI